MKVHAFADLGRLQKLLAAQRAADAARRVAEEQLRQRQRQERNLFASAIGPVEPLRTGSRRVVRPPPPEPLPFQRERDERLVMREALSDEFDAETLLHTDEHLSFRRPGLGPEIARKLRAGHWSIQRHIDLHGLRRDEAREALGQFLRTAHLDGLRCIRVVHGKGLGSPGKTPVLKGKVHSWLVQKSEVMAFVQARPADGGAGALVVLLRPSGRRLPGG